MHDLMCFKAISRYVIIVFAWLISLFGTHGYAQVWTDSRPIRPQVYAPSMPIAESPEEMCSALRAKTPFPSQYFNIRQLISSAVNGKLVDDQTAAYNTPHLSGWFCQIRYNQRVSDDASPLYPKPLKTIESREGISWMYPVCRPGLIPGSYPLDVTTPPAYCGGPARDPGCPINNPVEPASGIKVHKETDAESSGLHPLRATRFYRSSYDIATAALGPNWQTNWHRRLAFKYPQAGVAIAVVREDGRLSLFGESNGRFIPEAGVYDQLTAEIQTTITGTTISGYRLKLNESDATERYDAAGQLQSVTERNGWVTTLTYSTASTPATQAPRPGLLLSVRNAFGRTIQFSYDTNARITSLTASDGLITRYTYDTQGRLSLVTWPDNAQRRYHYDQYGQPYALTGITDEAGIRLATYTYDWQGRVTTTEQAGGIERVQYSYGNQSTTVTGVLSTGTVPTNITYSYVSNQGVFRNSATSAPCPTCGAPNAQTQYDANGNILRTIGHDGRVTLNAYDTRGRVTSRRIFLSTTDESAGTPLQAITIQWHPAWNLPLKIAEPGLIRAYQYDGGGKPLVENRTPTSDYTGTSGFNASANGSTQTLRWSYRSYISNAVVAASKLDGNTSQANWSFSSATNGDILKITDQGNGAVTNLAYDGAGRIKSLVSGTDSASFQYDARGRLTYSNINGVIGNFTYDPRGLYKEIRFSSGTLLQFRWNDAQQLIDIRDETGQVYTPQLASASPLTPSLPQTIANLYYRGRHITQQGVAALTEGLLPSAFAQVPIPPALMQRALEALSLSATAQKKPIDLGAGDCCPQGQALLSENQGGSASKQMMPMTPLFLASIAVNGIKDLLLDELIIQKGAETLACNIEKTRGEARVKKKEVAHHIVARNGGGANGDKARAVLKRVKMDVDDANNGMIIDYYYHNRLHTNRYYTEVTTRLEPAQSYTDAVKIFAEIRIQITSGTFPF